MKLERRAAFFGVAVSLALHAALLSYVAWRTSAPDLGFDFEVPMDVEFGLSEAVTVSAGAPPPSESSPSTPEPSASANAAAETSADASVRDSDAGVPRGDAGTLREDGGRRRRRERDAGPEALADAGDDLQRRAGDGGEPSEPGPARGVAFLPAGSQIALRLDVLRMRASPLADDIRGVFDAIPEWHALLDGSGIQPLEDLDRVLVASPNLERSRLIIAGRSTRDEAAIREAASRLASAAGSEASWRELDGVTVAAWRNQDPTERLIALVGPRHFVIAREEDIPRVLGVASARAAGSGPRGVHGPQPGVPEGAEPNDDSLQVPQEHPADALLSMEAGEGLSLEIEGFRNFARARPGARQSPADVLPIRVRLGLAELPDGGGVSARIRADFEDDERASTAASYWDRVREGYARNVITAVLGLSPVLSRLVLASDADALVASVDLELPEMRRLLALVRGYFEDRARALRAAEGVENSDGPRGEPSGDSSGAGGGSREAPSASD